MREEAIVKGLNILAEEVETLNSQIISELESKAPETTLRAEIRWGLFNYKKQTHHGRTLAYSNFLEELFNDFVSIRHPEQNADGSQLIDLGEKWEKQGSVSGKAVVLDGIIWVSFIPAVFERRIISRIQNDIDGKESKILTEFVQTLNSLPQDPGPFIDTLAHEMTHLWLIKTTEFGQAYEEVTNSIMQSMSNGNPDKHDVLGAKAVLRNPEVEAIDEAFAYYVSYVYSGEKQSADDLAFYDRPKTIEWGIEIIIEKAKRDNMSLDEVRYMMANVFHNLAHEGQIKENNERRNPRIFFLKEFLPANDKERLRKFKEISEGELSKSFKDLKTALKDMERAESSQKGKVISDLKKVVEEIDWNNPMHIHDKILHSVLEDAVGTYSLNELEKEICRELNNEVSQLENIQNLCQQLVKEEKSKEVSEELLTAAKKINEVEEDIKALK